MARILWPLTLVLLSCQPSPDPVAPAAAEQEALASGGGTDCMKSTAHVRTRSEMTAIGLLPARASRRIGRERGRADGLPHADFRNDSVSRCSETCDPPEPTDPPDTDGGGGGGGGSSTNYCTPCTTQDADADGWCDCSENLRRKLVLTKVTAYDEQEDTGVDEFYLVADDVRYPTSQNDDLDGYWDLDDGDSVSPNITIAERVRGKDSRFSTVYLEGWNDYGSDVDGDWEEDSKLFGFSIDLNSSSCSNGYTFKVRKTYDDYDYELSFKIVDEKFADPTTGTDGAKGDSDKDGIEDRYEYNITKTLGGIADPKKPDVLVELDYMPGQALYTSARRMMTTRMKQRSLRLYIKQDTEIPNDDCLSISNAKSVYDKYFYYNRNTNYKGFRYAIFSEHLWNGRSGLYKSDAVFVDDYMLWYWVSIYVTSHEVAQAGTLLHELGHSMNLRNDTYYQIDTNLCGEDQCSSDGDECPGVTSCEPEEDCPECSHTNYGSVMNYEYQLHIVDYSNNNDSGYYDQDDWGFAKNNVNYSNVQAASQTFSAWAANQSDASSCPQAD